MLKRFLAVASLLACLLGCATVDYGSLQPGRLSGSLFVMWVDEGGPSGDGTFLFVPDPHDPLTFRRADPSRPGAVIRPGLMYTDGGSIPKIAQLFNGLSPWGYAPAYMVHDWLFLAHHCIVDGESDPRFEPIRNVSFDESAAILGEAIRGLIAARRVNPNDLAGQTITTAVDSSIARSLWDARGACAASRVKPSDVAAAEQAIPGSTWQQARRAFGLGPRLPAATAAPRARVVARIAL